MVQDNICIINLFPPVEDELKVKAKFNMKHWCMNMFKPGVISNDDENLRLQFLYGLVERFSTALYTPEETVIK